MNGDFVDMFKQLLIDEFDCSEEVADRIALHAQRHQWNAGMERRPREWIELMEGIEAETVVQRWKIAVMSDLETEGE